MYGHYLSQCLIFTLLALSCLRVFFISEARIDSLAVLPAISVVAGLISFLLWGLSFFTVIAAILAIIVFFTNLRSLYRLVERLFVDHYNFKFTFFSILELICAVVALVFLVIFRPVRIDSSTYEKMGITEKNYVLKGSIKKGFEINENFFKIKNGSLSVFRPKEGGKGIVIFAHSDLSSVHDYSPYISFLSKNGYTVLASDFNTMDFKFFNNFKDFYLLKKNWAIMQKIFGTGTKIEELSEEAKKFYPDKYEITANFAKKMYGSGIKFYVVTDNAGDETMAEIRRRLGENALGYFDLKSVSEFTTNDYGFIEQTNPLLAFNFGLKRDKTFFIPRYCASKTTEKFSLH